MVSDKNLEEKLAVCFFTTFSSQSCLEMKTIQNQHCPLADSLSLKLVNSLIIDLLTFCEGPVSMTGNSCKDFIGSSLVAPYDFT